MDVQPSHHYIECQVPIRKGLKNNRFAIIDGSSFVIDEVACASFQKLKDYYNTLVKYPFDHKDFVLNRKEEQAEFFAVNSTLIPFQGKYKKMGTSVFKFSDPEMYHNLFLQSLILFSLEALPENRGENRYINVLLSRHDQTVESLPFHSDDFCDWVIQFNIDRSQEGIEGGDILIRTKEGVEKRLFSKQMDAYFVDDKTCLHGAEAITIKKSSAHRDVLIIRPRPLNVRSD